jgi:hypothetical protein
VAGPDPRPANGPKVLERRPSTRLVSILGRQAGRAWWKMFAQRTSDRRVAPFQHLRDATVSSGARPSVAAPPARAG